MDLTGRTAVVTGASRGIGLAIAQALAAAGANIVLTSRSQEAADAAAARVGGTAVGVRQPGDPRQQRGDQPGLRARHRPGPRPVRQDLRREPVGSRPVDGPGHPGLGGEHGGAVVNTASVGGMAFEANIGLYNGRSTSMLSPPRRHWGVSGSLPTSPRRSPFSSRKRNRYRHLRRVAQSRFRELRG
ncbi:SDR family NAD(P)-dependent oxidoreductase [Streptomyces sp. NPDC001537]